MEIKNRVLTGERALFGTNDAEITDCTFEDGESPLKESSSLRIKDSLFKWKYPIWYCNGVNAVNCTFYDGARAGMWYTNDALFKDCVVTAPKCFRRCRSLVLENVTVPNAAETLWSCDGVKLKEVFAKGDYFAMNCKNVEVDGLVLDGNYSFDGTENVTIRNSKLITKDAFWNSKNVTVYDSFISGEYLGWNSENLTLINCTIESLQGMCYINNLKLINCKLVNTTLAFEYSSVDAEIEGVDSVLNPSCGTIKAKRIGNLIIEPDRIDKNKTVIVCGNIEKSSDVADWKELL